MGSGERGRRPGFAAGWLLGWHGGGNGHPAPSPEGWLGCCVEKRWDFRWCLILRGGGCWKVDFPDSVLTCWGGLVSSAAVTFCFFETFSKAY